MDFWGGTCHKCPSGYGTVSMDYGYLLYGTIEVISQSISEIDGENDVMISNPKINKGIKIGSLSR